MVTVILTKDVQGFGRAGDICRVSDGHARNFLLRQNVAVVATDKQIAQQKEKMAQVAEAAAVRHAQAERLVRLLDGKAITVKGKHDHNTLFAAVDADVIANAVSALIGETIDADIVRIAKPIKVLGDHEVTLHCDHDLTATIRVSVVGE